MSEPTSKEPTSKMSRSQRKSMKEYKKLNELRSRVTDVISDDYDDFRLIKWLKARQFDVDNAETMLRNSFAYKEKIKINTLIDEYTPPEVIQKYMTGGLCGFDLEGTPIRVEMFGQLDLKGLMYSTRRSDLEKTKIRQVEIAECLCLEQTKKLGKRVSGRVLLFDMTGIGLHIFWKPGLAMYMKLVRLMEDNYPDTLKHLFVLNAPSFFPILYKIVRPLISEDTKNKIHVLGSNHIKTLVKYIAPEEIPAFMGGTKTDPDGNPNCEKIICHGGKVPESYYLKDQDVTDGMTCATVPRADKLNIALTTESRNSILRWEFKTEDYDIIFGVWRTNYQGEKTEVMVKPERVSSHVITEDGTCVLAEPGTYVACFDNTFSWTRSKKVYYTIEILTNELDEANDSDMHDLIDSEDRAALAHRFEATHL